MDIYELTIKKAHQGLIKKEFSAEELTKAFLDRIEKEDREIRAFLTITKELAISEAKKVDEQLLRGKEIPVLAGIPLCVKDNILVKEIPCTAASKILENYIAPYDATVIKKLKEKGAVILGKTNMDEFAMGSSTENSAFFTTKNPCDLNRVPGGSSGGSAAAVAANFTIYGLGSDTGGSIRQPVSFCGVVGLKPTYGTVSRYGLIAMASSLDQIGPITRTVEDCKIVFDVIRGKDPLDSTSVRMPEIRDTKFEMGDKKIGVPKEYFIEGIDSQVEKFVKRAIKSLEEAGAKVEEISLPHTEYAYPTYYLVMSSEASANLARFDGIKYGYSKIKKSSSASTSARQRGPLKESTDAPKIENLLDVYSKSREEGFGTEVRRRIMLGTYVLSAGYYQAYYLRAQKVRSLIKRDFEQAFKKVDFILTPTSPVLPFKIGERIENPLSMYLADIFTVSANLAGLPALSLPCGKVEKLPVGLQIIGKPFSEEAILKLGQIFEKL